MGLPDGLMPCFSSRVSKALSESISVSKAVSQLALPLEMTTFFASRSTSAPKGSAAWTVAPPSGAWAAAGGVEGAGEGLGAGAGLAAGAGPGLGDGDGFAETAGGGVAGVDCASAWLAPNASCAVATAATARRNIQKFIRCSPKPAKAPSQHGRLTRRPHFSYNRWVIGPALWSMAHHWPYIKLAQLDIFMSALASHVFTKM